MTVNVKNTFLCVCNKLCFSKPGITNHQKRCVVAKEAIKNGSVSFREVIIGGSEYIEYVKEIKEFVSLTEEIADDAHNAVVVGNKSAARRARNSLNLLRHKIPDIRRMILDKVKNKWKNCGQ